MGQQSDYESFSEDGYKIFGEFQNGKILNENKEILRGKSIRILSSPYKVMLTTQNLDCDDASIVNKLSKYSKNVAFMDRNQKKNDRCNLSSEIKDYLQELSIAAEPLKLSFEIRKSYRTVYNSIRDKVTFGHEFYAFWVLENNQYDIAKRAMWGVFNSFAPSSLDNIIKEKEQLLVPLKKTEKDGKFNLLFLEDSSCILFHEIVGHYFEIVNKECCDLQMGSRVSNYPLFACNTLNEFVEAPCFDDEGVFIKTTTLIRDGKCVEFLTDSRSTDDDKKLTGNCRRSSIYYYPEPRMRNIIIKNNNDCVEKVLDMSVTTIIITKTYQGLYDRKTGKVTIYAYAESLIQREHIICKKMFLQIEEDIKELYNSICATFGQNNHVSLFCKSCSGSLYTEILAPEVFLKNIYVKRMWVI